MFICVDFDGTIVDHAFPDIGEPAPGAIDYLKKFHEAGAKIILYTMRSDNDKHGDVLKQAVEYLENNGVTLYGVNNNKTQKHWTTSPKVYGHLYIDDAAFGCPIMNHPEFNRPCADWDIIGPEVLKLLEK